MFTNMLYNVEGPKRQVIDLSSLKRRVDFTETDAESNIIKVWHDSYAYRLESSYENKRGFLIIREFQVLQSKLAPALVRILLIQIRKILHYLRINYTLFKIKIEY